MLRTASPGGLAEVTAAEHRFIIRATRVLARQGIWRFIAVSDSCYPLVHQALCESGAAPYRVAYANMAAHNVAGDLTISVAGDTSDPGLVTGSQQIRELFGDEGRPVAVLITGVLERFADAGQAARFISVLMDWAPEGSFLAVSHALTEYTDPGVKMTIRFAAPVLTVSSGRCGRTRPGRSAGGEQVMPEPGASQAGEPGTELKELRDRYPGADIWCVRADGHTEWQLRVHADSPGHLEEALRDVALDGGLVMPK